VLSWQESAVLSPNPKPAMTMTVSLTSVTLPNPGATSSHLIPRAGTPDEVAKGIMFAVDNDFVTGTTIDVDGGWLITG